MELGISLFKVLIQGIYKHEIFRELNCILFYLCNILNSIVERFSFICGCKHD